MLESHEELGQVNTESHLGGHNNTTHVDHGALDWLVKDLKVETFLDIGCGPGGMIKAAADLGLRSVGIDGDYSIDRGSNNNFLIHDYTKGPAVIEEQFDVAWSIEFLEHVYEQYIPNFMHSFQLAKFVVVTYAPPGWTGHHHVNLQEESYWIDKFQDYHFEYQQELTKHLRSVSTMNYPRKSKKAFVKNRGLFFINRERTQ